MEIIQPDGPLLKSSVSVQGHLTVTLRHLDGRREVVVDRTNQVTYLYLDRLAEFISQLATDPAPADNAIHSLWVEASTIGVSAPTPNDTEPDANATVVAQKIFADADILKTISGNIRTVEYRATVLEAEANGNTLEAAALFTKGTIAGVPVPGTYTAGQDGVWMVARQLIGPIPKLATFAVDFNWGMTFQILDV